MPGLIARLTAAVRNRPERRDASDYGGAGLGITAGAWSTGFHGYAGENLSTILACINAVSSGLASVPARIYRSVDGGRVELPEHPLAKLIATGPNSHQTWCDWLEQTIAGALWAGNAISEIVTDGTGDVIELRPVPWQVINVAWVPPGTLAYDLPAAAGLGNWAGPMRRLLGHEILHLRDRSDDGLIGRSRLSRVPLVLDAATQLQVYASAIYKNGAVPSGALLHPASLSPEAKLNISNSFGSVHAGAANAKKIVVLEEGMRFDPFSISPEDNEVLKSRQFTVAEICRVFQVPPPLVQSFENNSFTSAETAAKWFAQLSLTPWARKIEALFSKALLEPGVHLEIDLSGLTRGDYAARWSSYATAVQNKILTANEIREIEGFNPLPSAPAPSTGAPLGADP